MQIFTYHIVRVSECFASSVASLLMLPNEFRQFPTKYLYAQKRCARGDTAPLTDEMNLSLHADMLVNSY